MEKGEVVQEYKYGWFGFNPKSLQRLASPIWLLVFLCFANVFQSMTINGLIGVILTSLETRFDLSSSSSSWIASAYDVSTVPMLILVSYFGSSAHRIRWTAAGLVILIVGTGIFVLPHFATDVYKPFDDLDSGFCQLNRTVDPCAGSNADESLQNYLWIFIAGRILHGVGAVPLYTIAVTYLDDCLSKEQFSLYISIFYAAGVIGPALGYVIGGYMLSIYTDFIDINPQDYGLKDDSDPRWVGAWWLAFILGGTCLFIFLLPLTGYPRDLPGAAAIRALKISEAYKQGDDDDSDDEEMAPTGDQEASVSIKELPSYFKVLFTNPTYMGLTLMTACDSLLIGGFTAFGPKYLESQFAVTSSLAGILFGILVIPGGAGGTVFGGYIIKRFKMKCASIMKWEAVFTLGIMATVAVLFLTCDEIRFSGVNYAYISDKGSFELNLESGCNNECSCEDVRFQPICSYDNVQYYSPCHAGCNNSTDIDGITEFYNCTCIGNMTDVAAATNELCSSPSCDLTPLWMAVFFVAMFLLFACSGMNISATVRCVPSSHRSLAIGIQWIALRCLGTIPGPVLFGTSFDAACVLFDNQCDVQGSCLFYNNFDMALNLFIVCVCTKGLSLIFVLFAYKTYRPPKTRLQQKLDEKKPDPAINNDTKLNGHSSANTGKYANENPAFMPDTANTSINNDQVTYF